MVILSFKSKKDKAHMLKKVKEMQEYVDELMECLEQADHDEYDDEEYYQERAGYRGGMRNNRYGYRRM